MENEDFKTVEILQYFSASGILGIFAAFVKIEISEIKPRVAILIKYGEIFLFAAIVDPKLPMSLYLFFL